MSLSHLLGNGIEENPNGGNLGNQTETRRKQGETLRKPLFSALNKLLDKSLNSDLLAKYKYSGLA